MHSAGTSELYRPQTRNRFSFRRPGTGAHFSHGRHAAPPIAGAGALMLIVHSLSRRMHILPESPVRSMFPSGRCCRSPHRHVLKLGPFGGPVFFAGTTPCSAARSLYLYNLTVYPLPHRQCLAACWITVRGWVRPRNHEEVIRKTTGKAVLNVEALRALLQPYAARHRMTGQDELARRHGKIVTVFNCSKRFVGKSVTLTRYRLE